MNKLFDTINLFKPQTKKQWKKKVKNKLFQVEYNNLQYDPIYFEEEIKSTNTFQKNGDWHILTEIEIKTAKQANKEALRLLKLGVDSICFKNHKNQKIADLLKNIQIDIIQISFKKFQNINFIVDELLQLAKSKNINPALLTGSFYIKSITQEQYTKHIKQLPNYHFLEIELNDLEKEHSVFTKKTKPKNIFFSYKVGKLMFFEIAKLRSFRIKFEQIFKVSPYIECCIDVKSEEQHHLIESCTKSITAILGGCSRLIIQSNVKKELNIQQQLILKYESFLHKVSDSLNGSYYIENVTQSMLKSTVQENKKNKPSGLWKAAEEIQLKSKYHANDLKGIPHLQYGVGEPPYLRGPYTTMYCEKKWTIRQYAGFSTAEESNAFYKKNLKAGQSGLSVAFDLPTHRGYDSDHERVFGDVGKAGVAIDSVEDMEILFKDIDLKKTTVSMTMNGAILPIMAFFIVIAKRKKIPLSEIRGTIQNDILKEFMVRNTYIYPPKPSMRIVSDIFKYTAQNMQKFNSISVSGYHMLEAGASADIEVAYTLSDGLEYVKTGIHSGLNIDDFAPRLSFFWGIGMNFFTEIAKIRAARILWAEMMASFKPQNPKSMMLRSHCQTSGWSLTAQQPSNNITRTTIEAIAAIIGGTQSLHTNALDEAMSLPTPESAKIARDTQLFLQRETDICKVIDPFGGSYYLEKLTHEIKEKAKKHIEDIEKAGGMLKAIELGIPKLKIEAAAIKRQTNIDNGQNHIIGLNCFQYDEKQKIDILEIDNKLVQKKQIKRLTEIKKNRNNSIIKKCLLNISKGCGSNKENLLDLAVKAAENKATLGEISMACEQVFGRHIANTTINSGIFAMEQKHDDKFILAQKLTTNFKQKFGRRPRILAAKLGQDGHDRGIKIIATSFSDIGFDVDIAPLFQTPKEIAKQAIENDVHIVGISSLAGGHKTLIPTLIDNLKKSGNSKIMIIAGGIIPQKDYKYLHKKGVSEIFGPGTIVIEAAIDILNKLLKK